MEKVNKNMEKKYGTDENDNIRLSQANVKGRLTQAKDGNLTLRLFLTDEQKNDFCLQKGKQPNTIMEIIVL